MNKNGLVNGPVKVLSDHLSGHFGIFVKYWPDNVPAPTKKTSNFGWMSHLFTAAHVSLQVMYYLIPL